jgi:hypothetical protein
MNVRQYNGVNRAVTFILLFCVHHCIVWYSSYCSVYPIVFSDIHFTALFTSLYCLTFILLLCLPNCIVWHSLYCSVYPIVRQYNGVNRAVKWMSDNTMGKQSSKVNVRQYNGINRAAKWISDNTTFIFLLCLPHCIFCHSSYGSLYPIVLSDIHFTALFTSLYCLTFILRLYLPHCIFWGK